MATALAVCKRTILLFTAALATDEITVTEGSAAVLATLVTVGSAGGVSVWFADVVALLVEPFHGDNSHNDSYYNYNRYGYGHSLLLSDWV